MPSAPRLQTLAIAPAFLLPAISIIAAPAHAATCIGQAANDGACVTAESFPDSRTLDLTISSPALDTARFPNTNKVRLRLPPSWSRTGTRHWPVLYLLHGVTDNHTSYTTKTEVNRALGTTEVLTVMPSSGCGAGYLNWKNASGKPAWETYHLTELRQLLERNYHAGTDRAISGISMGAQGSLSYATRHPGMFKAVAGMSAGYEPVRTTAERQEVKSIATLHAGICRLFGGYNYPWNEPLGDPTNDTALPNWTATSPWNQAPNLAGIPTYIYLVAGNGKCYTGEPLCLGEDSTENTIMTRSVAFHHELSRLGIPSDLRTYNGKHNAYAWSRELPGVIGKLMTALGIPHQPEIRSSGPHRRR